MKLSLALPSLLLSFLLAVATHAAPPPSAVSAKQALKVVQKVDESGSDTSVSASVGPLVNSTAGFGTQVLRTDVRLPQAIASIAAPPIAANMSEAQILAVAKSHFRSYAPSFANQMATWMRGYGVTFAWYSYQQKLIITYPKRTGPTAPGLAPNQEERLLLWTMSTDQNGRALYGDPKIVAPKPKVLYVVYTPLKVDDNLPATWQYPNAGTLFVQVRDEEFAVVPGTDERIDVHGAFDEPTEIAAPGDDPEEAPAFAQDAALPCLMNNQTAGCDASLPSVRTLMSERGATMAIVDYVRKVQPVYDESPAGSGNLVARQSLVISERKVSYNGCSDVTYSNKGSFGFLLATNMSRYLMSPDGTYGPMAQTQTTEQSPTQSYEGTVTVQGDQVASLAGYVINPVNPTSPVLVPLTSLNVQSLAGLAVSGSASSTLLYRTSPYVVTGVNRLNVHLYTGCNLANGTISFSAGWQWDGADASANWQPAVNRFTQGVVFTKGKPQSLTISSTEEPAFHAPCYGTATYDGAKTISLAMNGNCAYGDELLNGNPVYGSVGDGEGGSGFNWVVVGRNNDGLASLFDSYCPSGTTYGTTTGMLEQKVGNQSTWQNVSASGCLYSSTPQTYTYYSDGDGGGGWTEGVRWTCAADDTVIYDQYQYNGDIVYAISSAVCVKRPTSTWTVRW